MFQLTELSGCISELSGLVVSMDCLSRQRGLSVSMNWLVLVFQWTVCVRPASGLYCFLCVSWN